MTVNPQELSLSYSILILFKYLLILASVLYLVFSFVVIRQISIMKKTLITPVSGSISLLGWLHFGFALLVLLNFLFMVKP